MPPFHILSHFTLSVYFLLSFCSWLPSPNWRLWVELLRKTILMSWRRLWERVSWSFSIIHRFLFLWMKPFMEGRKCRSHAGLKYVHLQVDIKNWQWFSVCLFGSSGWPSEPATHQGVAAWFKLHPLHPHPRSWEVCAGWQHQHLGLPFRNHIKLATAAQQFANSKGSLYLG